MADERLINRLDRTRELFQDKLIQLNRDIRAEFDDLLNNLPEPLPVAPPAKAPASLSHLIEAVEHIHQALSQVDLLKALVEGCVRCVPRALLLIKKTGTLHGWTAAGFSDDFLENRLKKIRWPIEQYPELYRVVEGREVLAFGFNDLGDISHEIEQFDGFVPFKTLFLPLVVKNKVAALLYVDSGSDPQLTQADQIQLLTHITGLELTLVAAKAKVPPEPKMMPLPSAPMSAKPSEPMETDSSFVGRLDNMAPFSAGPQDFDDEPEPAFTPTPVAAPVAPKPAAAPPQAAAAPKPAAAPPQAAAAQRAAAPPAPAPTRAPVPAPEPPRAAAPVAAPVEEDDPATKKAKRAARVLVSDLILYNESAVRAARQSADLYQRLKEDIDRSYQHYKERISDLNISGDRNFFKEEIIRQLGEGNPNVLGPLPF